MKKILVLITLIAVVSVVLHIPREFTVEDWKEYLILLNPTAELSTGGPALGVRNIQDLPTGTHVLYRIEFEGTVEQVSQPLSMMLGCTVSSTESINGINTTVLDVTLDMNMDFLGDSMMLYFEGTEWLDETGAPVKMEGNATGRMDAVEMLISYTTERTGEEVYRGHDCWILSMTQSMEVEGLPPTEMTIVQYMDKESFAVVRMITTVMGEAVSVLGGKADTGYIEHKGSPENLVWELSGRETITTELGTYDCQIIYLKEDSKIVGTMWVNKEIKAPLKYVFSYKNGEEDLKVMMTLLEYTLGK
jgi:hypothetical protein